MVRGGSKWTRFPWSYRVFGPAPCHFEPVDNIRFLAIRDPLMAKMMAEERPKRDAGFLTGFRPSFMELRSEFSPDGSWISAGQRLLGHLDAGWNVVETGRRSRMAAGMAKRRTATHGISSVSRLPAVPKASL